MNNPRSWLVQNEPAFLAFHKPAGVLCQGSDPETTNLADLVAKVYGKKAHLLNRLDRPVQGLVLFSKSKAFTVAYQAAQQAGRVKKTYLALVEGMIEEDGHCEHLLVHDKKRHKAFITEDASLGRKVRLEYKLIKRLDNYTALKISLHSGKFHQIRAQLAEMGHPIKGDVKYGARRKNKDRSIYLCAKGLNISNVMGQNINIETSPSEDPLWNLVE
ncbi:MAG: RNA pseudouridine synthase [Saprospiraceae bacterium]|nr:RNA pseudouridine synthase [Saprospiraceae bacterium]